MVAACPSSSPRRSVIASVCFSALSSDQASSCWVVLETIPDRCHPIRADVWRLYLHLSVYGGSQDCPLYCDNSAFGYAYRRLLGETIPDAPLSLCCIGRSRGGGHLLQNHRSFRHADWHLPSATFQPLFRDRAGVLSSAHAAK